MFSTDLLHAFQHSVRSDRGFLAHAANFIEAPSRSARARIVPTIIEEQFFGVRSAHYAGMLAIPGEGLCLSPKSRLARLCIPSQILRSFPRHHLHPEACLSVSSAQAIFKELLGETGRWCPGAIFKAVRACGPSNGPSVQPWRISVGTTLDTLPFNSP